MQNAHHFWHTWLHMTQKYQSINFLKSGSKKRALEQCSSNNKKSTRTHHLTKIHRNLHRVKVQQQQMTTKLKTHKIFHTDCSTARNSQFTIYSQPKIHPIERSKVIKHNWDNQSFDGGKEFWTLTKREKVIFFQDWLPHKWNQVINEITLVSPYIL